MSPSEKACPFREKLFRFLPENCQPLLLLVAMCWAAGATNKANTLYLNDHHLLCRGYLVAEGRFLIKEFEKSTVVRINRSNNGIGIRYRFYLKGQYS